MKRNKFQVLNPVQQSLLGIIKEKLQYLSVGGACNLEPVRSTHGWAMNGIIKALNLSFQGEREKKIDSNYIPFWKRQNYGDNKDQ